MAWWNNPYVLKAGLAVGGGLYRTIKPDQMHELQMGVLEDMKANRSRLLRQSRGEFRPAEREQIRAAAEPGLNRLAGNIAQRGLGTSGAGAQVIADAAVRPYSDARIAAGEQMIQQDAAILDAISAFPADNSFFDDIGAAVNAYTQYKEARGLEPDAPDEDDERDGIVNGFLQSWLKLGQLFKQYQLANSQSQAGDPFIRDMSGNVIDYGF